MRLKPSASHWVKKESLLTYKPMSLEFLLGAQVVKISSAIGSGPSGRVSSTNWLPSILNDAPCPLTSTRARLSSSPTKRSGCAATAGLRRRVILLSTRVLAGSRSNARSTVSTQNAGAV